MDRHSNTKSLVESSILTAIAIVLILMCIYVPSFILVGIFVWPIPITFIYIRHGIKFSILSLVVTFIITSMASDPVSAFGLVAAFGVISVVLGYCITTKKTASVSIMIMAVTAFLSTLAIFKVYSLIAGQDVISQGIKMLTQSYGAARDMYIKMGVSKDTVDKVMTALPSPEAIRMIIPSGFITYSITVAFICYFMTQKILKRFKYSIPEVKPLSEWYIPSKISFAIILIFGISYIMMSTGVSNGKNYFLNADIIFNYAFTVNGIAFVAALLKKREIRRPLNWIIMVFCILPPIGSYLFLVGVFDYMIDFRKLDPFRRRPAK